MRLAQIHHLLRNEPLLCDSAYRITLLEMFQQHAEMERDEYLHLRTGKARSGSELDVQQMEVEDGVAIIPVGGPLGQNLGEFEKGAGAVDFDDIRSELQEAEADEEVGSIVLNFDSPGGMVSGTPETAAAILDVDKPIYAWTRGTMASAAYWLAAATDGIFATPSAVVGNIGVSMVFHDLSKLAELSGVKVKVFSSGPYKGMGTPGTSLTQEQELFLRARVMQIAEEFYHHVQDRRPAIKDEDMQGQFYSGNDAIVRGFVDDLMPDLDTLTRFLSQ